MSFRDTVASDYEFVDGTETVSYTDRSASTTISITYADPHDTTAREMALLGGVLPAVDRTWHLAAEQIPAANRPEPGDYLVDASGVTWEVTGPAVLDGLGIAYACPCTRAAGTGGIVGQTGGAAMFQAVNRSGSVFAVGQPVAVVATGVTDASATGNTTPCAGLATTGAAALGTETVVTEGLYTLADWTAVTGSAALTPGAVYFLSATTAKLTATKPTGAGNVVQAVGRAVSATTLAIDLEDPILLAA